MRPFCCLCLSINLFHIIIKSAGAVELRNSMARRFEVDLPATLMFDYPSLSALAAYLARQLAPAPGLPGAPGMQLAPAAAAGALAVQQAEAAAVTAVVGVSARFPGGITGKQRFWRWAPALLHTPPHPNPARSALAPAQSSDEMPHASFAHTCRITSFLPCPTLPQACRPSGRLLPVAPTCSVKCLWTVGMWRRATTPR